MVAIPRPEKILLAMYELSGAKPTPLEYEDIVVKAWRLFPEDFGLRKYVRQYPDASDIHKPLYGPLKDRGFVLSGNKKFRLTEKGLAYASELDKVRRGRLDTEGTAGGTKADRLSKDKEIELKRIVDTDAFRYFAAGQPEKILDTDFYAYLGTTVRTEKHAFLGRLHTVTEAVADAARISQNPKHQLAAQLHEYVCKRFADIIGRKEGRS